ncbi:unnamed protein product [Trichogramma brassicae]|uniref:Uncharacterized protein n=1 Tax=Trichogramma brassicae TaxID=86971 RepID=A0A6H5I046_9HYME|nr:unnamed protein product [Trichogramma brassicae]
MESPIEISENAEITKTSNRHRNRKADQNNSSCHKERDDSAIWCIRQTASAALSSAQRQEADT